MGRVAMETRLTRGAVAALLTLGFVAPIGAQDERQQIQIATRAARFRRDARHVDDQGATRLGR